MPGAPSSVLFVAGHVPQTASYQKCCDDTRPWRIRGPNVSRRLLNGTQKLCQTVDFVISDPEV